MADGQPELHPRTSGVVWSRPVGYTLNKTTLTVRVRWRFGSFPPARVELRGSPEQRQALRQELERYVPAAETQVGSV